MIIALGGLRGRTLFVCALLAGSLCASTAAEAATVFHEGDAIHVQEDGVNGNTPTQEENRIQVTRVPATGQTPAEFVITDRVNLQPVFPCHSGTNPVQTSPSTIVRCPDENVARIEVNLGDLDDFLFLNSESLRGELNQSTVHGGSGVDEVQGLVAAPDSLFGDGDDDILFGNGGSDTIRGNQGFDTLYGGAGDDVLQGGSGEDDFNGGDGTDTADYSADGTSGVGVAITGAGESGSGCFGAGSGPCEEDVVRGDIENLKGTAGADRLFGNDAHNTLTGLAGDDLLVALGGNDQLLGDDGNDRLRGGYGNDDLQGGNGNQDVVDYTERTDASDPRSDVTVDLATGTATAAGLPSQPGEADSISAAERAETGAGDDTLIGTDSSADPNRLHGGDGADLLRGKDGADQLVGGSGIDTVSYVDDNDDDSPVTLTLNDQQANDGSNDDGTSTRDTVTEVESAIGGPDDDSLTGSGANNELSGAGGNDVLRGLEGADKFYGGLVGADSGTDTALYDEPSRAAGVTADLDGMPDDGSPGEGDLIDTSIENITGSRHADTLTGNGAANVLSGSDGNDLLRGGLGGDTLGGGIGEDTVDYNADGRASGVTVTIGNNTADDGDPMSPVGGERDNVQDDVENVIGTVGADNLGGNSSANKLLGLAGIDTVNGFGGDDLLDGGEDGDTVNGSAGNDTLHGGSAGTGADGADVIDGSTGNDTVTYAVVFPVATPATAASIALSDAASKERDGGVRIWLDNLANDGATGENDSVNAVENAIGGDGADHIIGSTGAAGVALNRLDGRGGNDTLNPGAEGATPVSDVLVGGGGERDRADYSTRPDTDHLRITLDGEQNDGEVADGQQIENDHIHLDVEDVTTAGGNDDVTGNTGFVNHITTAGGNDTIHTRDGNADVVDCGTGTDTLTADRREIFQGCETAHLPPAPLVSVSGPQSPVGEGAGQATFRMSIDDVIGQDVTVQYATSNMTATAGQDYEQRSGTAEIKAGSSFVDVTVPIIQDQLDEDDETFRLTISNPSNATIAPGGNTATATIADDDAQPTVSVGSAQIDAGNSGETTLNVPVTLSAPSSKEVTVKYSTGGGTATAGTDYEPVTEGTVTIPAGQTTANAPVSIIGDTVDEPDETFDVTLTAPTNATLGSPVTATQTITDDDAQPKVSIGTASITEGDAGEDKEMTFTVTLSEPSGQTVTVDYQTADGTATSPADYTGEGGKVTIQPGQTTGSVGITVKGDTAPEANETFTVTLSNPSNADIASNGGTGTGTITDNDAPTISVGDATVTEGDAGTANATFTVTLSEASGSTVTVDYATASGTATEPADYTETEATLVFEPGQTSKQVTVPVKGDTLDEDDETFTLELSAPTGASIADGTGLGTITDDDAAPALSVSAGEVTEGDEGSKDLTFTVALSAASGRAVTVKYATGDGTAEAGSDYTATAGTLAIPAGETSGEVKVPVLGDTAVEQDETFTLTLSEPQNATIADGKGTATGTIKADGDADEPPPPASPAISVADLKVAEGDTGTAPAVFTVSLSVPTTATVTAKYATADGTARAGQDYQATSGAITFAPGERIKTVSVNVIGDRRDEVDEAFALTLSEPSGGTLGKASGAALITDDETPRVAPRRVTARTTPSRDRSLPYRYRTTGRVMLPSGVRGSDACAGKVQVRIKAGRKTISTRRAKLRRDCTFARSVSFGIRSRVRPGRLKVQVRFLGNAVLLPKSVPTRYVRAGR